MFRARKRGRFIESRRREDVNRFFLLRLHSERFVEGDRARAPATNAAYSRAYHTTG